MKFTEFITYCTLKSYVKSHKELKRLSYKDDRHFLLSLQGRGYTASIKYEIADDHFAIIHCSLWDHDNGGALIKVDPSLGDILEAFIPS